MTWQPELDELRARKAFAQQMGGPDLVLGTLNGELVGSTDGLFCFCGEVVEWRHTYDGLAARRTLGIRGLVRGRYRRMLRLHAQRLS